MSTILQGPNVQVLWGNKFIDIFKNGKLVLPQNNFIQEIQEESEMIKDGFYILNKTIIIKYKDQKISVGNQAFISYLIEQSDITSDQKITSLKNIGFYYNSLEEAQLANIKAGIICTLDTNTLYVAKDGILLLYQSQQEITEVSQVDIKNDNSIVLNSIVELKNKINISKPVYFSEKVFYSNPPNVLSDSTEFDNMLITGNLAKQLYTSLLPVGSIIMWYNTSIPEGWVICDGLNDTPKLVEILTDENDEKFIKSSIILPTAINYPELNLELTELTELTEVKKPKIFEVKFPNHSHNIKEFNTSSEEIIIENHKNIETNTITDLYTDENDNDIFTDSIQITKTVQGEEIIEENVDSANIGEYTITKTEQPVPKHLHKVLNHSHSISDLKHTVQNHSHKISEITINQTTYTDVNVVGLIFIMKIK